MTFSQKFRYHWKRAVRSRYLLLMMVLPLLYLIIFNYVPMYGAQIAFRDYNPYMGILDSPWVGFTNFKNFFNSVYFFRLIRNTLVISLTQLFVTFPIPIILALMLNEVRGKYFKRVMQTVIYLPHFISVVVVAGIVMAVLSTRGGVVNQIVTSLGGQPIRFFDEAGYFPFIIAGSEVWQNSGWGTIIYLAAITGIDPALYEAAVMDGANRYKQILYITIPSILPTIIILFILRIGGLFSVGYQKILLLYNPTIYETADIIQTFVYRRGITSQDYSFATAIDLFNSALNLILLLVFNKLMRRVSETSLW